MNNFAEESAVRINKKKIACTYRVSIKGSDCGFGWTTACVRYSEFVYPKKVVLPVITKKD